jgi:hypothetical protein
MAYVYRHIRLDTNETFYVGIGRYLKRAFTTKGRNSHWNNIVNKTNFQVEILEQNLSWEDACDREKYWIKNFGRFDLKEGNLVNKTEGGEGVNGHSDELKKILREHRLGKKIPEEQRKKISDSMKGKILSEEHKKNLSDSLKKRKLSEEHKKKIGLSMKGKLTGEKHPNYGKKLSEKTIEKIKSTINNKNSSLNKNIIHSGY